MGTIFFPATRNTSHYFSSIVIFTLDPDCGKEMAIILDIRVTTNTKKMFTPLRTQRTHWANPEVMGKGEEMSQLTSLLEEL